MVDGLDNPLKHTGLLKFFPFLLWRGMVNAASVRADLIAGLTGAVIVLPQGVAFAIIAGLPPEYGLYSAIVPASLRPSSALRTILSQVLRQRYLL